ncbi:hypothetical protein ACFYR1_46240 [Streptomyces canus]|uniref:hypothetical protein n=1 Tax=Streptomyces canus TaxID=58343 RepID=UPI0036C039CA
MPVLKDRSRRVLPVLSAVLISAGMLLTGCSGENQQDGKTAVASLPPSAGSQDSQGSQPSSGTEKPPSSSDSPGIQLRLDDTAEKRMQIRKVYVGCLAKNGLGPDVNGQVSDTVRTKAEEACKDKAPVQPPELDPAKNPHYNDGVVAVVKCLTSHGVPAVVVPATDSQPIGWTQTSADVPDNYDQVNKECMVKSFGSHS